MSKSHVCVAFIPDDVRGKRTSPEGWLYRLRRANQGPLTQEWEIPCREETRPGQTWTISMEEAWFREYAIGAEASEAGRQLLDLNPLNRGKKLVPPLLVVKTQRSWTKKVGTSYSGRKDRYSQRGWSTADKKNLVGWANSKIKSCCGERSIDLRRERRRSDSGRSDVGCVFFNLGARRPTPVEKQRV
ncbi:hypothetical protein JTB14_001339 [Gonioctena quinquepunctata]|nr:hypothetical protein JTB14_001339 [Gonioctena quinquepunctata]